MSVFTHSPPAMGCKLHPFCPSFPTNSKTLISSILYLWLCQMTRTQLISLKWLHGLVLAQVQRSLMCNIILYVDTFSLLNNSKQTIILNGLSLKIMLMLLMSSLIVYQHDRNCIFRFQTRLHSKLGESVLFLYFFCIYQIGRTLIAVTRKSDLDLYSG